VPRITTAASGDRALLRVDFDSDRLPRVGERCRRMLLCHPPVKKIRAYTRCCGLSNTSKRSGIYLPEESKYLVQNDDGVTIGDLLDAAAKLKAEHSDCPHANYTQIRRDGSVKVIVQFQIGLRLEDDEPILVHHMAQSKATAERMRVKNAKASKMRAYGAARHNGEEV